MKSPRRFKLIIWSGVVLVGLVLIVAIAEHQQHSSPSFTQKIVDMDTGEVAYIQPNKEIERTAGGGGPILFGSSVLFDNGATQNQFQVFKSLVNEYSGKVLKNNYKTITIVPKSIHADAGDIKGQMRLGQGSKLINVEIKLSNLYYVRFTVSDPSGQYQQYDSGTQPRNIQG